MLKLEPTFQCDRNGCTVTVPMSDAWVYPQNWYNKFSYEIDLGYPISITALQTRTSGKVLRGSGAVCSTGCLMDVLTDLKAQLDEIRQMLDTISVDNPS